MTDKPNTHPQSWCYEVLGEDGEWLMIYGHEVPTSDLDDVIRDADLQTLHSGPELAGQCVRTWATRGDVEPGDDPLYHLMRPSEQEVRRQDEGWIPITLVTLDVTAPPWTTSENPDADTTSTAGRDRTTTRR
jgi:hypothetical protein